MIDFNNGSVFKLTAVNRQEGHKEVEFMLVDDEQVLYAFKTVRDKVVITDKRIITINVQGISGKKTDYTTLPYSKVQAFSIETAGSIDLDCELELWFSGLGKIRLEIRGDFDIRAFNKILSGCIL